MKTTATYNDAVITRVGMNSKGTLVEVHFASAQAQEQFKAVGAVSRGASVSQFTVGDTGAMTISTSPSKNDPKYLDHWIEKWQPAGDFDPFADDAASPAPAKPTASAHAPQANAGAGLFGADKDASIVAQVCVKAAAEVYSGSSMDINGFRAMALDMADVYNAVYAKLRGQK